MGAGASTRSKADRQQQQYEPFEQLPCLTISQLQQANLEDGTRVQVVGHVEVIDDMTIETPFHETKCVAAEVVGSMARWEPLSSQAQLNQEPATYYHKFVNVLRESRGVSFALRDPPAHCLVESPNMQGHIVTHEGAALRVILPAAATHWRRGYFREQSQLCSAWLGHRQCEPDLHWHPAHGVMLGSSWELSFPKARLISAGRVAPHAHAFWNEHITNLSAKAERWNAMVAQGEGCEYTTFLRRFKVTERTLREGDSCCVVGAMRRTATGGVEIHCGEGPCTGHNQRAHAQGQAGGASRAEPLLISIHGAAKALPPRAVPSGGRGRQASQ